LNDARQGLDDARLSPKPLYGCPGADAKHFSADVPEEVTKVNGDKVSLRQVKLGKGDEVDRVPLNPFEGA
jgi:hypothetical protein